MRGRSISGTRLPPVALDDAQGVREPQLDIGDRDYFRQTIVQGRPIISEPIQGRASNEIGRAHV